MSTVEMVLNYKSLTQIPTKNSDHQFDDII